MRQTQIFSGSSHPALVDSICECLGQSRGRVDLGKFSNGETKVQINESVRDQEVFIVQSGSSKINDNVMELLIMISACRGGSAKTITAVMPYFPYSRQSKKKSHRGCIAARLVANLLKIAGVDHIICVDLHASQMKGFFHCPVENLVAEPFFSHWIKLNIPNWRQSMVVSKNPGGTKRAASLADALKINFGIVMTDRRRPAHHKAHSMSSSTLLGKSVSNGIAISNAEEEKKSLIPGRRVPAIDDHDHHDEQNHHANAYSSATSTPQSTPSRPSRPVPISRPSVPHINHHILQAGQLPHRMGLTISSPTSTLPNGSTQSRAETEASNNHAHPKSDARLKTLDSLSLSRSHSNDGHDFAIYDGAGDVSEGDGDALDSSEVVTGRLVDGHIVDGEEQDAQSDDDVESTQTGLDHMASSMASLSSAAAFERRVRSQSNALGGSADAVASSDDEEEQLKNPEMESTATLVGNVKEKTVFIMDDMIDKSASWIAAAETVVKRGGATHVYCMATHGLFGEDALMEMEECECITGIVVTNSFPIPPDKAARASKLVVIDVSNLLAEAIRRTAHGESISRLLWNR